MANIRRIHPTGSAQANLFTQLEIEFLPRLSCGNLVMLALMIIKGLYNAAGLRAYHATTAFARPNQFALPVSVTACKVLRGRKPAGNSKCFAGFR
jgi:hypothetical protein